jgi:hypothetical protein
MANPEAANQLIGYTLTPRAPITVAPGARLYDPVTHQWVGGSGQRGDNSSYDLEQAGKVYESQYGPAANRDINAPDFQWWYRNQWPSYGAGAGTGTGGADAGVDTGAVAGGQPSQPPKRGTSEADIRRYDQASNATVKNYMALPGYQLVANGSAYLSRIESAQQHPGSISDQELLDSVTKLNNAGGQVTDAQVKLVLEGQSLADKANVWRNQMIAQGGVLSDSQRKQLNDVAHAVYAGYQKMYSPIYNEVTKKLKNQGIPEQYWTIPDLNTLSSLAGIGGAGGTNQPPQYQEGATATGPGGKQIMFKNGQWVDPSTGAPVQ